MSPSTSKSLEQTFLFPVTGLYNECHEIDHVALLQARAPQPQESHGLRSLNNLWWRHALSEASLEEIVECLHLRMGPGGVDFPPHWEAILADPKKFVDEVHTSAERLVDLGAGPRNAFRALETLTLFTQLHSELLSAPYELKLQEGYVVNELSSLELLQSSLDQTRNPYLKFLERSAFPYLRERPTDLAWIVGRIKLTTFAMARFLRKAKPEAHISVIGHSSEYYSLNKIDKHLRRNGVLFSVVDSIILDDFDNTPLLLAEALRAGDDLRSVPNLMYRDADGIHQTGYVKQTRPLNADLRRLPNRVQNQEMTVPSSAVAETRLWPESQCYWNNCNFCAINRRYNTLPRNDFSHEEDRASLMTDLHTEGVEYLWSVDEAIPPRNLGRLADRIVEQGPTLFWETRSKVDKEFTDDICTRLGRSNLVEIRLGLESANPRVLSLMGKHPNGWSLELIESIVASFHAAGVSVHFPSIVGFPGETREERLDTYQFLEYITAKYPSVTFNVNILGFDVASKLFEEYPAFGVTTLRWPAPARYFLGNLIDWDCEETPFDYPALDAERNSFMRRVLYPWMPETAQIAPYIFYRLTETSRATMVWKRQRRDRDSWYEGELSVDLELPVMLSNSLVVMGPFNRGRFDTESHYLCFSWSTHQIFECDEPTANLLRRLTVAVQIGASPEADEAQVYLLDGLAKLGAIENSTLSTRSHATFADAPRRWIDLPEESVDKGDQSVYLRLTGNERG